MAAPVRIISKSALLGAGKCGAVKQCASGFTTAAGRTKSEKMAGAVLGAVAGGAAALTLALHNTVRASEQLHPQQLPWSHNGPISSLDHASIRRGYEVYKQVCAACHSLKYVAYRELIGVSHTEAEAKAEAEAIQVEDGPNDEGDMFMRPGRLSDYFQSPYKNDMAARAANNGALPPDLTYITSARHGGEDYLFHLLTGYCDPPAGVKLQDGQYYNPYFPGGAISMAQALYNEIIEYEDGTPATQSQLAKDVATFLKWTAEPEHDTRKLYMIKVGVVFPLLIITSWYLKRRTWSIIKTRKLVYNPPSK